MRVLYLIKTQPILPPSLVPGLNESRWYQPFSEPVRQRIVPTLAVVLIASSGLTAPILGPKQPGATNAATWIYSWSEPVRAKIGLRPHLQRFFQNDARFIPPINTFMSWWIPWQNPVRTKIGIYAWLQHFYEAPPRRLPPVNVTVQMAATEIDSDVAIFDINVYTPATPTASLSGANVSIVEVIPGSGQASIKEGQ